MLGSGSQGSSCSAGDGELFLPEVAISKEGVFEAEANRNASYSLGSGRPCGVKEFNRV